MKINLVQDLFSMVDVFIEYLTLLVMTTHLVLPPSKSVIIDFEVILREAIIISLDLGL